MAKTLEKYYWHISICDRDFTVGTNVKHTIKSIADACVRNGILSNNDCLDAVIKDISNERLEDYLELMEGAGIYGSDYLFADYSL